MTFSKYNTRGAYHWASTLDGGWQHFSPKVLGRYELIVRLLETSLKPSAKKGVDLGCGDGVFLFLGEEKGHNLTGLDNSFEAVQLANAKFSQHGRTDRKIFVSSCCATGLPHGAFDYATSIETIEHLDHIDRFLSEVRRILQPEGLLLCTTPNRSANELEGNPPNPFHVQEFTAIELQEAFEAHFTNVRVLGAFPMWLDRLYTHATEIRPLDMMVRSIFKLVARASRNPYASLVTNSPTDSHKLLIVLAQGPKQSGPDLNG